MTATTTSFTDAQRELLARMSAPPGEREGLYPVTSSQRGLWFLDQLAPGGTAYHMPALLRMRGTLEQDLLAGALQRVVDRHEALRTTFVSIDGLPLQRVVARRDHQLSIVDTTGLDASEALAAADDAAFAPFDLGNGPLVRSVLWRLADNDHLLLLVVHHIIADGWSVGLLLADLAAAMDGRPIDGHLAAQPVDLALREAASTPDGDGHRFWATTLAGAESPRLPVDILPSADACGTVRLSLPDAVVPAVRELARRLRTTDHAVYLAALAAVCHRMTGQTDVVIGVPFAGRNTPDTQRTVGFLVNTLPVRIAWQGEPSFAELIANCARAVRDAMAHDDVPFGSVVEQLGEGTAALIDVMLVVNPELVAGDRLGELDVEPVPLAQRASKVPLTVNVDLGARQASLGVEYDPRRFAEDVVSSLSRSLRTLLVNLAAAADLPVAAVPLLDPSAAADRVALGLGPLVPDVLAGAGLGDVVAEIADDDPGRIALVEGNRRITYAQLVTAADRLATVLRARTATERRAHQPIGVYLPRGIDAAVASLGVIRAGGHYLPLDPAHPRARTWSVIAETDPALLVTTSELLDRLGSAGVESIRLDQLPAPTPDGNQEPPVGTARDLAAIVQARPAGLLFTHQAVARFVGRLDRVYLHTGPVASDVGLRELWGTLLSGASGVIIPPDTLSPDTVAAAIREHAITTARLTAPLFLALERDHGQALSRVNELEIAGRSQPAGRVRTDVHVLDAMLRPVPVGALGEVHIGGPGVAIGFPGRPGLTADRFVPSPFGVGQRLFRTGEKAYPRADGSLVMVGGNVPDALVALDQLPLDGDGELDPAGLPDPALDSTREPPASSLERCVAAAWADLLGVDVATISRSDNFFRLGGHSLLATRLVARLSAELSRSVPVQLVFDHPTLAAAARAVSLLTADDRRAPVLPLAGDEPVPLSFGQQRLWFLHQFDSSSPRFNLPLAVRLRGPLDTDVLQDALRLVVDRHETLRTTYVSDSDPPRTRLSAGADLPMSIMDLANRADMGERAARVLRQAALAPFDLGSDLPLRAVLVRVGANDHVLLVVVHHIACDGWSIGVLARDLSAAYSALRAGRSPELPELPMRYGDFAAWQRTVLSGELLDEELAHWSGVLAGAPTTLDLPTDHPRPPVFANRGGTVPVGLSAEGVRWVAAAHDATPFMVLLAALAVVLHRCAGQDEVVIGTPVAGRARPELANMVGCFIDVVPLRIDLSGNPSVGELLARVRRCCVDAYAHPDLPFERLVEHLAPERDLSRTPVFQVMLALENGSLPTLDLPGVTATPYPVDTGTAQHDLTFWLRDEPMGISGTVDYNRDVFEPKTVSRLVDRVSSVLEWLTQNSSTEPLSDVDVMPTEELACLTEVGCGVRAPVAVGSVADLVGVGPGSSGPVSTPVLTPKRAGRVAVTCGRDELTYRDLERLSHEVAAVLVAHGIRRGDLVGVMLPRSAMVVPVLLGVWLAGAAYVPLDPEFPVRRLEFMAGDSGMRTMVSTRELVDRLPNLTVDVVALDELLTGERPGGVVDRPAVSGTDRAYVMYTSGSTGRPKGVMVPHAAVVNLLWSMVTAPGITDTDRFLAVTTLSFDISVLELFGPLVAGARLVIASAQQAADPVLLAELIESSGATVMQATPSTWRMLLDSGWRPTRPLRIWCGGEPLPQDLAEALLSAGHELSNVYGPTETTIWSTVDLIRNAGRITLGRPVANTDVRVLDSRLRPVPIGAVGELFIGGTGVADGYLGRPGLTAERFLPADDGSRLYRTGDLARFSHDGYLLFAGRADQQVKVRGHRIELGEIETHLATHPAVTEAVLAVHDDRLIAYLVADRDIPTGEVRHHLRAWVPDYMIPSTVVALDVVPRTLNGKIDRNALPIPTVHTAPVDRVAPRTPLEGDVLASWSEVLGIDTDRISTHDDFFVLGGHSMLATRVAGRLSRILGYRVSLRMLFEHPTAAGLAAALSTATVREEVRPPLAPEARGVVPLSFAQQRLWFLYRLEGPSPTYNIPLALRLSGPLDRAALADAFDDVVDRHEILRTVFPEVDGTPRQVVLDLADLPPVLHTVDTTTERLAVDLASAARHGFELATEIPLRAWLYGTGPDEHVLLFVMHHIAGDEPSLRPFADDFAAAYAARCRGEAPTRPALPVQYADYALWQRRVLGSPDNPDSLLSRQLAFWTDTLKGLPEQLELPVDHQRSATASYRGAVTDFTIGGELLAGLRDVAHRHGASVFMVLQAAVAALLTRLGAGTDIPLGVPVSERTDLKSADLVGLFVNAVVLRADTSGDPSFGALVSRVRDAGLAAYEHGELPFDHLVEALNPARSLSRHPLFQVVTAYQNAMPFTVDLPGLAVDVEPVDIDTAKFDLGFAFTERPGDRIDGMLVYATDLFEAASARSIADRLIRMLERVLAQPSTPIGQVDVLSDVERHRLLVEWNDTAGPEDTACWPGLFEATVARFPDATAVVCADRRSSYAELNAAANRLAHRLIEHGAGPERLVGLSLPRSVEAVIAVLAVLKSGAAYLPLDLDLPADRMGFMADDAAPVVVLTSSEIAGKLPGTTKVVLLDDLAPGYPDTNPRPALSPANAAYVIYTSGSTGTPKGVVVSHTGVASLLRTSLERFDFDRTGRVLQFASMSFDVAFWELSLALLTGARLVIVPAEQRVPGPPLVAYAVEHGVTHLGLPPSVLAAFPDDCVLPPDATVVTGTERVPSEVVARFGRGRRLFNAYGPTEATVNSTLWEAPPGWTSEPIPIGRPDPDTKVYVLDSAMGPMPPGVVGELYLAGPGLARGYLNRPGITAERFLANPFGEPGARMYRTGDLVRWNHDGCLEFAGRVDDQVKIRGFRVEPGEIEAVLARHPAVREAVVVPRDDLPGGARLVAYLVGDVAVAELRRHVAATLPHYMVPSAFTVLESLPRGVHGKVDKARLPQPVATTVDSHNLPTTPTELSVAAAVSDVLGLAAIGLYDDLFELGGHSLQVPRIAALIAERTGVEVPLREIFLEPTVAGLSRALSRVDTPAVPVIARIDRTTGGHTFPLSFQQTRLWILEQLDPGNPAYHVPITLRINGSLRVAALYAALRLIVERHEVLRTRFEPGSRVQVVADSWTVAPALVDLSGLAEPDRERELTRIKLDTARRPFDLWSAPPLRVVLVRVAAEEHVLMVVVHHIACDGWSIGVLANELSVAYAALCAERTPELPELPVQYGDFSVWQQERLAGDALRAELDHWSGVLAGAPLVLDVPTDHPRPAEPSNNGGRMRRTVDEQLVSRLERLAKAHGVSQFMVLLAAYGTVLSRLSLQDSVLVGTATAGRSRPEIELLVGCFIDVMPLRVDLAGDPSISDLLARVRRVCTEAYAHQDLPFERLVEHLQPDRDLSRTPVFQVMLNMHDTPQAELTWPDLRVLGEEPESGVAKYDLTLDVHRAGADLMLDVEFNRDVFDPVTVSRMLERVELVLAWFGRAPGTARMSDVDIMPSEELAWLRASRQRAPVATESVTELVVHESAQPLAAVLIARGVRRGDAVGMLLPTSTPLAPVLLGVWLAGGTCVPLDPESSLPRLGFLVAEARVRVVVSCAELADRVPGSGVSVVLVEGVLAGPADAGGAVEHPAIGRADPAFVIYPAESTGRPTGLVISHGAVVNLLSVTSADPSTALAALSALAAELWTCECETALVGRLARTTPALVLDARLRPVPVGVTGELYVGGPGRPDGYLRRPGLTAERFPPSPFVTGERLYRTGELASVGPDGALRLAGPAHFQVMVRGHRLRLGEIESRLSTHAGVTRAAVAVHDDGLVAYLESAAGAPAPTTTELRDHVRDIVPGYLLRTSVMMDAIPRTRTGQFDRDTLPVPGVDSTPAEPVAPRDAVETLVLDRFRQVLDRPGLGVTDDFFDNGGSSIAATRLLAELEQATGHQLVLRALFRETTAAAVAAQLRAAGVEPVGEPRLPGDLSCAPLHPKAWSPDHVLVTGVADFLGVALVERLLADEHTNVTYLHHAGDRLDVDFRRFGGRLRVVAGEPGVERFGLQERHYADLVGDVAAIYHGPSANQSVRDFVRDTHQVIRFAAAEAGKVVHLLHLESTSDTAEVGEELAYQVACRGVPVTITRGGPATAHQGTGASNPLDPLTLCLTAALRFGLLPDLPDLVLQVMPVDQVADAIVRIGRCPAADGQVMYLASDRCASLAELATVLTDVGQPVRIVPFDSLSAEQSRLLAPLRAVTRPAADADRIAAVLGRPPSFAELTAPYVRRCIDYLTANHASQGER